MYESGLSTTQIAGKLGVSAHSIYVALKKAGTVFRTISNAKVIRAIGAKSKQTKGYVFVRVGRHKRVLEHILAAEKALGRKLKRGEVVHHIDGNPANNANSNLLVCSRAYHTALHWRMRSHPEWRKA